MTHIAETNTDVTLGVAAISTSTMAMINIGSMLPIADSIGLDYWFLLSSVWSFASFFFATFIIKESKGLTDKQQKSLYHPKHLTQKQEGNLKMSFSD